MLGRGGGAGTQTAEAAGSVCVCGVCVGGSVFCHTHVRVWDCVALSGSVCPSPIRFGRPARTPSPPHTHRGSNELSATHICLHGGRAMRSRRSQQRDERVDVVGGGGPHPGVKGEIKRAHAEGTHTPARAARGSGEMKGPRGGGEAGTCTGRGVQGGATWVRRQTTGYAGDGGWRGVVAAVHGVSRFSFHRTEGVLAARGRGAGWGRSTRYVPYSPAHTAARRHGNTTR